MKETILEIKDECNVRFHNIDLEVRRKLVKALCIKVPYARHTPQYKAGRWDGTVSFITQGGGTFLNLLDKVLPIISQHGYQIKIKDNRKEWNFEFDPIDKNFLSEHTWPKGHRMEGQQIILEDHQVRAANTYLSELQCVQEISTGAGKTILCAVLSKSIERYGRSVLIVPSKDLVVQTESDFKMLGLDVGVFYGDRKELNHLHTICTWQSLESLNKRSKDGLSDIDMSEITNDVVSVIVDESHTVQADVLKRLLTGPFANIPIRIGMTGTVPKEEWNWYSILSSIGPLRGSVTAKELQDKGFLANCRIDIIQSLETVKYDDWHSELDYLVTDTERIKWLAWTVSEIAKTGNTLVLVDRIECGEKLKELISDSIFINGSVKSKKRKEAYDEVNIEDEKVVIATYGVAAVGINIPRIFNLIIVEAGKSFVRTIQSIGRGLRRASDKDSVRIWDITSNCKFSARHLTERKRNYKDAQYPFKLTKIDRFDHNSKSIIESLI
ncbi:MAG: DEAD/DEAH box helicase family protein [Candidimonas sp.]